MQRESVPVNSEEPLKLEIEDFVNCIIGMGGTGERKPLVDGEQAITALKVAMAALESIKSGKVISIGE